jgi:Type IX secretion system membrane protein PorP/SprF
MSESQNGMVFSITTNFCEQKSKIILLVFFILVGIKGSFAQQNAIQSSLYVTYPQNPLALNPAYAGSSGIASVSVMVRKQSLVLQGASSSQFLSYNTPLANGKFGMGLQAFTSNFGQTGSGGTGFNLGGSYRHHFTDSISISVGAQAGFVQIPGFLSGAYDFKPIAGAGAYFRTFNSYLGVSMPVFTKPYYALSTSSSYYFLRPIFVSAGHVLNINENFDLKFGAVFRQLDQNQGSAIDLNAVVWVKKWLGLGIWKNKTGSEINANNAFIITADAQISQKFRLGISYDAAAKTQYDPINPQTGRSSGLSLYSFTLRYDFDNLTGKINNFRYF